LSVHREEEQERESSEALSVHSSAGVVVDRDPDFLFSSFIRPQSSSKHIRIPRNPIGRFLR
jgi:hypothetical protein